MANIEYVAVTADNSAVLDSIEDGVFDGPVRSDFLDACLANPHQFLIVALDGAKVVGKALGYVFHLPDKPAEIYVEELDVAKKWRRRGIATGLMRAVGEEGRRRGIAEYWLIAEKGNKAAHALYRRLAHKRHKSVWYEFYC